MSTAFKARFPINAVRNLRSYSQRDGLPPDVWSEQQAASLKVGDVVLCFDPIVSPDGATKGLATNSALLVFKVEGEKATAFKLTDDVYSIEDVSKCFQQSIINADLSKAGFLFAHAPIWQEVSGKPLERLATMNMWGELGTRSAPKDGLPDPLAAFLATVGNPISSEGPLSIGLLAQALVIGRGGIGVPDLSSSYSLIGNVMQMPVPENAIKKEEAREEEREAAIKSAKEEPQAIASVSIIEDNADTPGANTLETKNKVEEAENKGTETQSTSPSGLLDKFKAEVSTGSEPGAELADLTNALIQEAAPKLETKAPPPPPIPLPIQDVQAPTPATPPTPKAPPPSPLPLQKIQPPASTTPQPAKPSIPTPPAPVPMQNIQPPVTPTPAPVTRPASAGPKQEAKTPENTEMQPKINPEPTAAPVQDAAEPAKATEQAPAPVQELIVTEPPQAIQERKAPEPIAAPTQPIVTSAEITEVKSPKPAPLFPAKPNFPDSRQSPSPASDAIRSKLSKWAKESARRNEDSLITMHEVLSDDGTRPLFVTNMLGQVSAATEKLEDKVSTLKAELQNQLSASKQQLTDREQRSMLILEGLKSRLTSKLTYSGADSQRALSEATSKGKDALKEFETRSTKELKEIQSKSQMDIDMVANDARQIVEETIRNTKSDLTGTVSRTEDSLKVLLGSTERSLEQITQQCSTKLDERVEAFTNQSKLLEEGLLLAMEAICEAAKVQAHQSEQAAIERIETLAEESWESIKEEFARLDRECSRQMDRLSRDTLLPHLQSKRQAALDLTSSLQTEFTTTFQKLLQSKLEQFEPYPLTNKEFCHATLLDFRSKWTAALEQHEQVLYEMVTQLDKKIKDYLAEAHSIAEGLKDVTRVTDHVLANAELIARRDAVCHKFETIGRDYAAQVQSRLGSQLEEAILETRQELAKIREQSHQSLKQRGTYSVNRVKDSLSAALKEMQDIHEKYAGKPM